MPRRRSPSAAAPLAVLGWLAASALVLFLIGQTWRLTRTESSQLLLARHLGVGNPAHITRVVGRRLREALIKAGVEPDSISERVVEGRDPAVVWRVGLGGQASRLQVNYMVTRSLEKSGAAVVLGREGWSDRGVRTLTIQVGLPRRATHEVQMVQFPGQRAEPAEMPRIALVLFGLGDQPAAADSFFRVAAPFGVALAPGLKTSREIFRAAHQRGREVVLHLPLEPINYPRLDPGPGTLLVTMKPAQAAAHLRRYLDDARPVAAVANHMGSLATQDMTLMRAVFHELKRSQMPFLHVSPAAGAVCKAVAGDMGVPYAEPDMVVDLEPHSTDQGALDRRWKEALERAHDRGHLIVWLRATRATREWLPRALAPGRLKGASIVPLAALVRSPDPT